MIGPVVLVCDTPGCSARFVGRSSVGDTRREAVAEGWDCREVFGTRRDACPEHKALRRRAA